MITLVLETSTPRGGVALFRGEELVFSHSFTADRSHSSELFAVVERALAPDLRRVEGCHGTHGYALGRAHHAKIALPIGFQLMKLL